MSSDPTFDKLPAARRRLLKAIDQIEAAVRMPYPSTPEGYSAVRWNFSREAMLYFTADEAIALVPLMGDCRPAVASAAAAMRARTQAMYSDFRGHLERWVALPPEAAWPAYRHAVLERTAQLRTLLSEEERNLHRLLPAQPGLQNGRARPINYAGDAWEVRDGLLASGS